MSGCSSVVCSSELGRAGTGIEAGIVERVLEIRGAIGKQRVLAVRIDQIGRARLQIFVVMVVAQAERQLELVVEVEIGLAENPVGFEPEGILVVAIEGGAEEDWGQRRRDRPAGARQRGQDAGRRSEEHTSELQSLMRISYAV